MCLQQMAACVKTVKCPLGHFFYGGGPPCHPACFFLEIHKKPRLDNRGTLMKKKPKLFNFLPGQKQYLPS